MQSPAQEKIHKDPRVFILNLLPWIHHVSPHKIIATLKSIFIWIFFHIIKSYHVSIQVLQKQWTQDRITSAFWSMHIQHSSMLESSEATSSTLWTKKMCKVNEIKIIILTVWKYYRLKETTRRRQFAIEFFGMYKLNFPVLQIY